MTKIARQKDDYYPTPSEATESLLQVEKFKGKILEPACGEGHISKILMSHGHQVVSNDLIDRGYGTGGVDFLMEYERYPNIITNPPFKLAKEFILRSLELSDDKVAMFLRLAFLESQSRKKELFDPFPPARVWVFSKRLTLWINGDKPTSSGTMAFCWMVWDKKPTKNTQLKWL